MQRTVRYIRFSLAVLLAGLLCVNPLKATALTTTDQPSLIITEIKIKNDAAGYNEFIELYNADITSLNLNNFTIEYYNSPAPADNDQPIKKTIVADGMLLPTQTVVLAANKTQITGALDSPFSSLADAGGLVRVSDLDGIVQDQVAWTSTSALAISPVLFLSSSTSNKTKSFTRGTDDQGNPILINPAWQLATPSPHADTLLPVPKPDPEQEPAAIVTPDPSNSSEGATQPIVDDPAPADDTTSAPAPATIELSELLPNPAAPASDSTDEFIELYNPNDQPVDLTNYRLQTGSSYSYSYTFKDASLAPHEYKAYYVNETGDILSNSAGQARLLAPDGQTMAESLPYTDAPDGQAWVLVNGGWQWTTTPTPNAANVLTLPAPKASTTAKTTAAKKTTSKTAASKASTAKPKTTKATTSTDRAVYSDPATADVAPLHPAVLAGVGVITLVYAGYEYRHDALNTLSRLRRYRALRRATRPAVAGR